MALAIAAQAATAQAQGDLLGVDDMAEAIVSMTSPVWTGPRTTAPDRVSRPPASLAIRSPYALLTVHAGPGVSDRTLRRALQALEHARARLDALGWPSPIPDGDLGGGPELDLYLSAALPAAAYSDGLVPWSYLDRASTFAVVSPALPAAMIDACVTSAYAEAMLMSAEPAEARSWRRATAAWLTWELTGYAGCNDAVLGQQAEPHRSWIAGAADGGSGGMIWLAYLSERHDAHSRRFIRDVWALASQRTWEGTGLRAEPDLWSAIDAAVSRSGDRLLDNVEELAVLRWFVGRGEPPHPLVASLDADAKVPVTRRMTRLPSRVTAAHPLQPFGSAYATMNAAAWNDSTRLHCWLRGEYGVRWSLVAVQLDGHGNETRRIAAPHTTTTPNSYLPIELDERTQQLLLVVTNLSNDVPDADEADVHERAFELIVDRATN
ncbi:MAG: hypothetical protein AMJ62_11740 [Myxococcales bacterium SG8_38]|nr:MAG: hypothetical protein AMJ62_11740 [Myxococcales bacterium SG8_38]